MDWNNPDVNRAFEYFSSRVDDVKSGTKQQSEEIRNVKEENLTPEELRSIKAAGRKPRKKARSHSTRKYKEYPGPKDTGKKAAFWDRRDRLDDGRSKVPPKMRPSPARPGK